MADKPKKPKKPAFYRNKDVGPGQLPKGYLDGYKNTTKEVDLTLGNLSSPASPDALPLPKLKSSSDINIPNPHSSAFHAVDLNIDKLVAQAGSSGALAKLSANQAKSGKVSKSLSAGPGAKTLDAKSKDSAKKEFKAPSIEVPGQAGDLLSASMDRTRPADAKFKPFFASQNADGANKNEFDTSMQKPHALSMRYRIPTKLEALFSNDKERLKKLGDYIMKQIRLSDSDRAEFIHRLTRYRQIWKDFVAAGLNPAFEGAHDVHVPMAYSHIKAMHARIFAAIMDITPRFSLKPRTPIPEIQKEDKEEILNWVINDYSNMQQGWDAVVDEDIWNFVADGKAITKQYWLRDVRKFVDVETTERRPIQLDEDGFPVVDEKEVEKEEVLFDCPVIEPVKLEDFWIVGKKLWDVDKADLVDHMQDYSKSDLIKASRLGFFNKEAVDELLKDLPPNPPNQQTNLITTELKYLDDYTTGIQSFSSMAGIGTYKIHECYLRYDIDDDGIDEELVVWMEDKKHTVLRVTYLERVGPGGKRPFTIKLFTPDGKGLGELLYGLNNEIDYIHNMRLDYGTLQNLPFFFYRAASGLNPTTMKLGPGTGIPLDNPNEDVMFPRLNGGTAYGFQEEQAVTQYGEKTSGINGFSMGQINQQGATRTATGTAALVNELNSNIDIHIKRYQRGFKRNLYILDLQCQDLLPLGTIVRVAGIDGKDIFKRFEDRDSLRFSADYELTANSINSNKAIERETAQMLVQQLANPIALQTGITTQLNLYAAFKNLLQKFEIKDIDAYITKPQDAPDSPYSAKDEINMIIAGVQPPLVIKDKHPEKANFFNEFEQSEDFSWLTADHMPLYLSVKKYHDDMASAIQAQAANPVLQNGMMNLGLSGQLAAGAGAPHGVAQQQQDLGQGGGQLHPGLNQGASNPPGLK